MTRACRTCGVSIEGQPAHRRFCFPCWTEEVNSGRWQAERGRREREQTTNEGWARGWARDGAREQAGSESRAVVSPAIACSALGLDLKRWRQLAQLVHPDKHGGSAAANDAAAFLNGIRRHIIEGTKR